MIKWLASLLLVVNGLFFANAQITGYELVPAVVHTGAYADGVDLTGFITWHLFVTVTNPTDHVSAIYGTDYNLTPGVPDDEDIEWVFDCELFQHEFAGPSALDNNCGFWGDAFLPSMEYDSFFTFDALSSCDPDLVNYIIALPVADAINNFEGTPGGAPNGDYFDGGTFFVDDGAIFTLNDNINGIAGPDLKVLIAQLTTCGGFTLEFGVQVFIDGDGNTPDNEILFIDAQNPCEANPIDTLINIVTPLNCFGETATIEFAGGGNGDVTYEVWDQSDTTSLYTQIGDPILDGFGDGCYFVTMMDSIGCPDTSGVFCFIEPTLLEMTTDLTSDVLCFGDLTGEICVDVIGGTPDYTISTCDGQVIANGSCVDGLSCGLCIIEVEDLNGCAVSEDIQVNCPDELLVDIDKTNVSCNGACDGTIVGSIDGGTGTFDVTVLLDGDPFTEFLNSEGPFDLELLDLCPGTYDVSALDDEGCLLSDSYIVTEPEVLEIVIALGNVSCAGLCDGEVNIIIDGGTGPFNTEILDADGIVVGVADLCGGTYAVTVTDENLCAISDSFEILEPEGISYEIFTQGANCFGFCDGVVFVQNLTGGDGVFDLTLDGNPLDLNIAPDSVGWITVCAGMHNVEISYNSGACLETIADIEILEPEELQMNILSTNITCSGDNDGTIDIQCIGGFGDVWIISPDTLLCPNFIDSLGIGDYQLTIEDSLGCQSTQLVSIIEPTMFFGGVDSLSNVVCQGDCDGYMSFAVQGGVPDYTIVLNSDLITGSQNELCAGEYTLSIMDQNGCLIEEEFEITEPNALDLIIAPNNATCTGMNNGVAAVVDIGGTGPVEISFIPEDLDLSELFAGVYPVYAIDSVGCEVQDTIFIGLDVVTDMELFLFSSPETCWNEDDGTATLAVLGGFQPLSYYWDDPLEQNTSTAIGLPADEWYTVVIVDSLGCTLDTAVFIDHNAGCFFISTAVTPNGDGYNDTWTLGGFEYFNDVVVQVYNRWGQVLYESRGYSVPWDGRHNGKKLPVADYYYIITYSNNELPLTGTVTLKY
jgi:gliding motility-associated-like protein